MKILAYCLLSVVLGGCGRLNPEFVEDGGKQEMRRYKQDRNVKAMAKEQWSLCGHDETGDLHRLHVKVLNSSSRENSRLAL